MGRDDLERDSNAQHFVPSNRSNATKLRRIPGHFDGVVKELSNFDKLQHSLGLAVQGTFRRLNLKKDDVGPGLNPFVALVGNVSQLFMVLGGSETLESARGKGRGPRSRATSSSNQRLMFISSAKETLSPAKKQKSFATTIFEGMIAGGTAGVTVETALYPIDTIKTRLQVARTGGGVNFKGLYAGLSSNLVGVLPASAIFVGVYEPLKAKLLNVFPPNMSVAAHLTSGAAGGAAASLIRVPTEVIKQRMQTGQFSSAVGAVRTILAREGVKGLFAGYGSFLLRDLPFDAIQFAIYEQLKITVKKAVKRDLRDSETAVVGALAGAFTGAVTTPLDVIKTRLMTQGTTGQYKGIIDCILKTSAEEGASALFKGVGPRVLWIGIGGSIFFGVLEKTKQLLAANSG